MFNRQNSIGSFCELPKPDSSIDFFEKLKSESEKFWEVTDINRKIFGFQIQNGTKWNKGLSENELMEFQKDVKLEFPEELKNFYRIMNGLDKKGINVNGNNGEGISFKPIYYSYPIDLELIKENINWIYESNEVNIDLVEQNEIPKIFPIIGHRFLIIDENKQILSMYGNDIIYWSENISKLIATDIFNNIKNVSDFESNEKNMKSIKFWLD